MERPNIADLDRAGEGDGRATDAASTSRRSFPRSSTPPLRDLWRHASRQRSKVVIATVLSLVNKVFDVLPELLIGVAVDVVVNEGDSLMSRITGVEDRFEQLLILAGVTIVIWLCESASDFAAHVMWRNLAQSIEHDTRMEVYGHVQTLEMSYFEDTTSGGMMTVLNDDVNQLERFLDTGADDIIQSIANVVLVGLVFAIISPTLMVLAFLPIPIIVVGSLLYQKRLEPRYDAVRSSAADIGDTLSNSLGGVATVKAFSGEAREVARLEVESRRYAQVNGEAIKLSSAFIPIIRIAILAGFVMTLVVGGKAALDGTLAVGMYSVLVFMTQRLLWPLTELGQILDLYQRAMASCRRIFGLLELQPNIAPGTQELARPVAGDVRFDAVEFNYHRPDPSDSVGVAEGADAAARASVDRRVLRDFSLHVPAGETHAIVGSTGSGKSTVLKLLLRLYEPDAGTISLDGVPTDSLTFASLRGATGLVPQDVFLFHGTVAENIAYGRPDAPREQIVAAAELAEADGFISAMPHGYDSLVGERGQKLSGGQRQRITIARAILRDPSVLLLDEATSAIDNETEAAIQASLARVSLDRTTIVIAHRLSTIRHAHRIHVMEAGRIIEAGDHDELIALGGLYAALWRVQTGERTSS
ncbi:MAG TPA: ABC transporter ATP-binding protein [Microthrixaceae bacterium]|nr:ABC transporter ATP-binding protein [Microthrixaceae bacterium]